MNAMTHPRAAPPRLTRIQRQSLRLVALGYTIDAAARVEGIQPDSMSGTLLNARKRLGAATTTHAVALAIAWGILDGAELIQAAIMAETLGLTGSRNHG